MKKALGYTAYFLAIIIFSAFFIRYIGQRTIVEGNSMLPALADADQLVSDKISYRFRDPERFDIIFFPYEYEEGTYYIKRIIGLPGETVRIDPEGSIYVNGELLEEHYGLEPIEYAGLAEEGITLEEDEYFVLGDNRNISKDSRYSDVGNIRREDIIGRVIFRIYPLYAIGPVQ